MGFWNKLGQAADKTYSVAEALIDWAKNHPRDVEILRSKGFEATVNNLTDLKYKNVPCNEHFNGTTYHTVGEYMAAKNEFYENYHDGSSYGNSYDGGIKY